MSLKNTFFLKNLLLMGSLIFLLMTIILLPILKSGYVGDDAINSTTKGYILETGKNTWEMSWHFFTSWLQVGRIAPISFFYCYHLFNYLDNLFSYKIFIIILTLFNLLIFAYWLFLKTGSEYLSFCAILLMGLLFQFRIYHDALYSYHGLLQLVFLFFISSLIFFVNYINTRNDYSLFLSLLFFVFCLLTYEITYPLFIVHIMISYYFQKEDKNWGRIIKMITPFIMVAVIIGALAVFLKFRFHGDINNFKSDPYAINFEFSLYISVLAKQISASFPLSYFIFDPHKIFENYFHKIMHAFSINFLLILIIYTSLFFFILKNIEKEIARGFLLKESHLLGIGLLILVLPEIIIPLSPKLQKEINWGCGYLPIYFSYYGMALIILYWIIKILKIAHFAKKNLLNISLSLILALIGIINYKNNNDVVEKLNHFWKYPRNTIEIAIKKGLFREIQNGSFLVVESIYPWESKEFYRMQSGIRFENVKKVRDLIDKNCKNFQDHKFIIKEFDFFKFPETEKIYYLYYRHWSEESGFAVLGQIREILANNNDILSILGKKAFVFVHHGCLTENVEDVLRWLYISKNNDQIPITITSEEKNLIASGNNWKIYFLKSDEGVIDLKSITPQFCSSKINHSLLLKNDDKLFLEKEERTILHQGFISKMINSGVAFKNIQMKVPFTIEMIVKPSNKQVPYAVIISNHPGYNNFEGFVFQQEDENNNNFLFGYGNGRKWIELGKVCLLANEWNYIVITMGKDIVRISKNGKEVNAQNIFDNFKISEMPLHIGNWFYGDRPFQGWINEIKITEKIKNNEEIQNSWEKLKKNKLFNIN